MKLLLFFRSKEKEYKGLPNLLYYMVNKSHPELEAGPRLEMAKIQYQSKGLNLQRINFFPNNEDWERLRILAYSRRMSMAMLFVLLLLSWDKFERDVTGVPEYPRVMELKTALITYKSFSYIELHRLIL